jgi:hypothetical protein
VASLVQVSLSMWSGGWGSGEPGHLDLAVPSARFNPDCAAITVWATAGFAAGSVVMERKQCPVRSFGALGRDGLAYHLASAPFPAILPRRAPSATTAGHTTDTADTWPPTTAPRHTLHIQSTRCYSPPVAFSVPRDASPLTTTVLRIRATEQAMEHRSERSSTARTGT